MSSGNTIVEVDITYSDLMQKEHPRTNFVKFLLMKQKFNQSFAEMIRADIKGGNFYRLHQFLRKAQKHHLCPLLTRVVSGETLEDDLLNYVKSVDSRAKEIFAWQINDTTPYSAYGVFKTLTDLHGYLEHPGGESETYEGTYREDGKKHEYSFQYIARAEIDGDLKYIINYYESVDNQNSGNLIFDYRTEEHDSDIDAYDTGYPYSKIQRPEPLRVVGVYTMEIDGEEKYNLLYTTDTSLTSQASEISIGIFPPVIPILHDGVKIHEDDSSILYRNIKDTLKRINIPYPGIAKDIIKNTFEGPSEPPSNDPNSKSYKKAAKQYNHSRFLKHEYDSVEKYIESLRHDYEEWKAAKDEDSLEPVDIFITMYPLLDRINYASRVASFLFFEDILESGELGSPVKNPHYTRRGASKVPVYTITIKSGTLQAMFEFCDYSIRIYEVDKGTQWYNVPDLYSERFNKHLLKAHKTLFDYGKDYTTVRSYTDATLVQTIHDNTRYKEAQENKDNNNGDSQTIFDNNDGDQQTISESNEWKKYYNNGYIIMAHREPSPDPTKERFKEIVLHGPLAINLVTGEKKKYSVAHPYKVQQKDDDGNVISDDISLRKMFLPVSIKTLTKHYPFLYIPELIREMMHIEVHYEHVTEIPWWKSTFFMLLLGLILTIIVTLATGGSMTTAIVTYVVSVGVSYGVAYLAKALNMPWLTGLVTIIMALVQPGSILSKLAGIVSGVGDIIQSYIEQELRNIRKDSALERIKEKEMMDKLEKMKIELGMNDGDLKSFFGWITRVHPEKRPTLDDSHVHLPNYQPWLAPTK